LVVGAINTPNHPPFIASKFSAIKPHTRAIDFILDTYKEIKSSPKSKDHSNQIMTSEREILVFICALALGLLFFFLYSCVQLTCNQNKRHQVVVVLVVDLVSHLIEEKGSLGLGDRLREGKG
jgi:F0F1-type ATP synthase membrane subunit a